MQTFLPYADFRASAQVLDQKRLGKQRVETLQIVGGLCGVKLVSGETVDTGRKRRVFLDPTTGRRVKVKDFVDGVQYEFTQEPILERIEWPEEKWYLEPNTAKRNWGDHVVGQMWKGHEYALLDYQRCITNEWVLRGYRDTCLHKTSFILGNVFDGPSLIERRVMPEWLGDERVHASHRANLLRKDPVHYGTFGWTEDPEMPYYWPRS